MNCLECGKAQCTEHRRHAVPVVSVDLKAIRARVARAAPGPWEAGGDDDSADGRMLVHDTRGHVLFDSCEADWSDMDFAAHARQDIPALLDHVDSLTRQLEEERTKQHPCIIDCQQKHTIVDLQAKLAEVYVRADIYEQAVELLRSVLDAEYAANPMRFTDARNAAWALLAEHDVRGGGK